MKIMEIYRAIQENRQDWVVQNLGKKLEKIAQNDSFYRGDRSASAIVANLVKADPENGNNIVWIARQYANGQFRMEDLDRIRSNLELFRANKNRMANRDLNSYPDMRSLLAAIEPFRPKEDPEAQEFLGGLSGQSKGKIEDLAAIPKTRVLIKTPNFLVTIPETLDSSKALCKLHGKTEWCTQNTDMFKDYSSQGPLYVIAVKQGNTVKKYQFHVPTEQYKDKDDNDLNEQDIALLSSIPEYTKFLNYLIKKHYGKYLDAK